MILRPAHWLGPTFTLVALLLQISWVQGDADFESVRIHPEYRYMGGRGGDPKEKYWHESIFHPHYDGRFIDHTLPYEEQKTNLTLLMQSYLWTMADLGAETWIIHGTLLGWWWNRKILPWDSDIDVQMTNTTVHFLASYYNMTIHNFKKRNYLLEVNPKYTDDSYEDRLNVIDARWIDTETGLFIDITAVRPRPGKKNVLCSKDQHEELTQDLFPLRDSIFEGQNVKIPYDYAKLLTSEYGTASLTRTKYSGHEFNTTSMEWERIKSVTPLAMQFDDRDPCVNSQAAFRGRGWKICKKEERRPYG